MKGKCPKCEASLSKINILPITGIDGAKTLQAAIYTCPHCDAVLSAGPDPYVYARHIAQEVKKYR